MPNEQNRAMLSKRRGQLAARITDSTKRREFVAAQGEGKLSEEQIEADTMRETNKQALQSYKKGGIVKRTGPALLHKGEKVLTESESHAYDFRKQKGKRAPVMMKKGK